MGHMGFDSFGEAAFENGIVPAMLKVAQDPRTDTGHGLSSYSALDSMIHLMRTGTADERRALLKELLANDVVEICISVCSLPIILPHWPFIGHSAMIENQPPSRDPSTVGHQHNP